VESIVTLMHRLKVEVAAPAAALAEEAIRGRISTVTDTVTRLRKATVPATELVMGLVLVMAMVPVMVMVMVLARALVRVQEVVAVEDRVIPTGMTSSDTRQSRPPPQHNSAE